MIVYLLDRMIAEDGGGIFVAAEADPHAGIDWTLTGNGTLTPLSTVTDASGVACAVYRPTAGTPAAEGESITVQAEVYA